MNVRRIWRLSRQLRSRQHRGENDSATVRATGAPRPYRGAGGGASSARVAAVQLPGLEQATDECLAWLAILRESSGGRLKWLRRYRLQPSGRTDPPRT